MLDKIIGAGFLAVNLDRVNALRGKFSDDLVADILNAENGTRFTGAGVAAYADISNLGSRQTLVSKESLDLLLKPDQGPQTT